ncbi:hypothetical protein [Brevundimonas sp.]|jgi:hypothetical protein|uniref:hypothetical protein n=1 Tax=Brevundimonas sp. TaxID=1871086 RepID=UPI002E0DB104|nr:hypothetical protein [Brevundimonas sp.]
MFMSIQRPAVETTGPDAVAVPWSPTVRSPTPRALHARLLDNAAQRRLRGLQRRACGRPDDADYWLGAAPQAVRKACDLRREGLPTLP